jgi:hypothetical protein
VIQGCFEEEDVDEEEEESRQSNAEVLLSAKVFYTLSHCSDIAKAFVQPRSPLYLLHALDAFMEEDMDCPQARRVCLKVLGNLVKKDTAWLKSAPMTMMTLVNAICALGHET